MSWKICVAFTGGAQSIGDSSMVITFENAGEKIAFLPDMGFNQRVPFTPGNPYKAHPDFETIFRLLVGVSHIFIFLTHAHLDHVGGLPFFWKELARRFPRLVGSGRVTFLMTRETAALAWVPWSDTLQKTRNADEWKGTPPPFTEEDFRAILLNTKYIELGKDYSHELAPGVRLCPLGVGHMLGAAGFGIEAYGRVIFHTGDISFDTSGIIAGASQLTLSRTDLLISDSTCAAEDFPKKEVTEKKLAKACWRKLMRGGKVLIPSFKMQRGEDVRAILLREGIPPELIFFDGGICKTSTLYQELLGKDIIPDIQRIDGQAHRERLVREGTPCVIIASGGMIQGSSLEWAKLLLGDDRNAIFIVGWCDPCTPGAQLTKIAKKGLVGKNRIEFEKDEKSYPVNCEIAFFHLSAHAPRNELIPFWRGMNPVVLALVHGEKRLIQPQLRHIRRELQTRVIFPKRGTVIDL